MLYWHNCYFKNALVLIDGPTSRDSAIFFHTSGSWNGNENSICYISRRPQTDVDIQVSCPHEIELDWNHQINMWLKQDSTGVGRVVAAAIESSRWAKLSVQHVVEE